MKFLVILVNSIWTSEIVLDSGQSQNVAKIKEIYDQEAKFSREILNDTEIEGTSEMCSNQRSALGRTENCRAKKTRLQNRRAGADPWFKYLCNSIFIKV